MLEFYLAGIGILRRQWPICVIYGLLLGSVGIGQHWLEKSVLDGVKGTLIAFPPTLLAHYTIAAIAIRMAAVREGLADPSVPPRIVAWFLANFVVLTATSLGLVLLVVPGILVSVMWGLAPYFPLVRGIGVREALDASRKATSGHRMDIFAAIAGLLVLYGICIWILTHYAGGLAELGRRAPFSRLDLLQAAVTGVYSVLSFALGIGIFSRIIGRFDVYDQVFA
jgi:hypothetical protein